MFLLFALIGWISPGLSEFNYSDFLISVVFIASLVVVLEASRFEYPLYLAATLQQSDTLKSGRARCTFDWNQIQLAKKRLRL